MNSPVEWRTDSDGIVLGFGTHDGWLYGLKIDESISLFEIKVKNSKGELYTIKLSNVYDMNILNYWGGNTILSVYFWSIEKVPQFFWESLFAGRYNSIEDLKKLIARCKNTHFFALNSSYGAEIYATCDDLLVLPDTEPTPKISLG